MTAASTLSFRPNARPAGICWDHRLVVPLRVVVDDLEKNGLLPKRRLAAAILPLVGGGSRAPQGGNNLGGGVVGKVGGETHGRRIHVQNKSAMRKIILATSPQCGHIRRMSNTAQRKQALRHDIMLVVKANGLEVTGDFWLMLIFRTESELKKIAQELHIKVAP